MAGSRVVPLYVDLRGVTMWLSVCHMAASVFAVTYFVHTDGLERLSVEGGLFASPGMAPTSSFRAS